MCFHSHAFFQITVIQEKAVAYLHDIFNSSDAFDNGLQLTHGFNVLLLPVKPFFGGVIPVGILRGGVQAVTRLFHKKDHAQRDTLVKHGLIVRFLPDIILFDVLFGFTLIHPVQVVGV